MICVLTRCRGPSEQNATKKEWDAHWGRIGKEGNMWWLGSARKNWEAVMGDSVWMWFREYSFFLLGF